MSHGFYADGDGPHTEDSPFYCHFEGCACAGCWYEREQLAQDLHDEREAAVELQCFPSHILEAMEIIAADHQVKADDWSHRWWLAYVIQYHRQPGRDGYKLLIANARKIQKETYRQKREQLAQDLHDERDSIQSIIGETTPL